ncbi:hypothetical protein [Erythrobacter neustonensis]|uniref:Uncharacterized protein n=1 Tax=Erythrobacter neustonensis TaxID=1112 RepID=A0A192D5R0_9SPHN|nr:hypothetical protein [Erythrobacter neustonensis]ANK13425.1 hypothetical protein A9D12_11285 [Erythrobacter neustonensis]
MFAQNRAMSTAARYGGEGLHESQMLLARSPAPVLAMSSVDKTARMFALAGAFLLSWQLVRIPEFNFTISDAAFLVALGAVLLGGRLTPSPFGRLTVMWMVGVLLLLGGLFLGSLFHEEVERWFNVAVQYLLALFVLPLVLASFDREFLGKAGLAFAYGVAVSQVVGIAALKLVGYEQLTPIVGRTIVLGNDRIGALTAEPNANGAVCVFALVILASALLERRIRPLLCAATVATVVAGLVFSASFTSLLALVALTAIIAPLTWSRGFNRVAVAGIMLATVYIGLGGPIPDIFMERVGSAIIEWDLSKAGTFEGRTSLILDAWHLANGNLLVGLGVDQFRDASIYGAPVHNLPLLLLNEGGLLSFAGLAILVICLFFSSAMAGGTDTVGGAICFAALTVLMIYIMSLPHMYARHWFGPVLLIYTYYLVPRVAAIRGFARSASPSAATSFSGAGS